jgi:ABC-2 type transport system permease protein
MVLKRAFRLFTAFAGASLRSEWAYRGSFFFEVSTSLVYLVIALLFWQVIYTQTTLVAGWSQPQVFILLGFSELFWATQRGILCGAFLIPSSIQMGIIERWLTSPLDPRFGILLERNQIFMFVRSLPSVVIWFVLGIGAGVPVGIGDLFLGLMTTIIAVFSMTAIITVIGSLAFWLGQSDALSELAQAIADWTRWPTNVFSDPLRLVLTYVFPIALAATLPASAIRRILSWQLVLGLGLLILLLWGVIQEVIWRRGIARYEGYGG